MPKLDSWIDNKILQNIIIWACLYLIITSFITADDPFLTSFFILLVLSPPIYINNLLVLPRFYKNKWGFGLLFIINALLFASISVWVIDYYSPQPQQNGLLRLFGVLLLSITFGSALKLTRDSFIKDRERKKAELQLLKAQMNPHFLFNTLNNLYGLSVVKSEQLPKLMLKLSDLLRYSLYDTREEFVPLSKDIEYIENYIALEQIRLEDQTEISFTKSGNLDSKFIIPMLLIVFVENAFKHLSESKEGESRVLVNIEVDEKGLSFQCSNSASNDRSASNGLEKGRSGIGLDNAKKRLELMYPGVHKLDIEKGNELFEVHLTIDF